jgi:bifunctional DNA-binding transcriptional regulator/antitoxin component of YhaV-PrlF toxin-antitoxin module
LREHFGAEEGDRLEATVPEFLVNLRETLNRVRTDLAREPE